jgi:hypothetical protein
MKRLILMNKIIAIIFSTIIINFMLISCDEKVDENNETKEKNEKQIIKVS